MGWSPEGERSIHNFKRTLRIAGSALTGVTVVHIFFKELTRVEGLDDSAADPDTSYERARHAVFSFLHKVDPHSYPSLEDPAMKMVKLWRTYYEELFGKPENNDDDLETVRRTAEAQVLMSQALVKLQAMGPSKTQTDAVLSVVTMQREAVIREGAMESLLCRQMHMIAPQPEDAYGLSLLTEQRKARVRAAATSALWNQLQQRKMSQATEGLHLESALLTLVDLLPRIFFAIAKVRMAREALTGSQPVDDTSEDVAEDLTKHGDHTSGSA